jgi:hypothetical protein
MENITKADIGKRPVRHMTYEEVRHVIAKYAHEMLPQFADRWSRFPEGEVAATIVNYLNDKADFWWPVSRDAAEELADAASEIIVRCG